MPEPLIVTQLRQLSSTIESETRPGLANEHWKSVQRVLSRTGIDPMRVGRMLALKSREELGAIIAELAQGQGLTPVKPVRTPPPAATTPAIAQPEPVVLAPQVTLGEAPANIDDETLHGALRTFKKRLKVTQLDEDSKLSNRALTGGSKGTVAAITPPSQFPRAVWDALVSRGYLKYAGSGTFSFVKDWGK